MSSDPISGAELRSMLRTAERSANYLAGKVGVSRTQVLRWQASGVPEKHLERVRELLPLSPGHQS